MVENKSEEKEKDKNDGKKISEQTFGAVHHVASIPLSLLFRKHHSTKYRLPFS
jgi:hypothetical protein